MPIKAGTPGPGEECRAPGPGGRRCDRWAGHTGNHARTITDMWSRGFSATVRDPHAHVCVSCSVVDGVRGTGCINCRYTGMDQTPCTEPGHLPHCPSGCCDQPADDTETNPAGGEGRG